MVIHILDLGLTQKHASCRGPFNELFSKVSFLIGSVVSEINIFLKSFHKTLSGAGELHKYGHLHMCKYAFMCKCKFAMYSHRFYKGKVNTATSVIIWKLFENWISFVCWLSRWKDLVNVTQYCKQRPTFPYYLSGVLAVGLSWGKIPGTEERSSFGDVWRSTVVSDF